MKEYIEYQNGKWRRFREDGEEMNTVTIIDNDTRPLTEEALKELGFADMYGGSDNSRHILITKRHALYSYPILLDDESYIVQLGKYNEHNPKWKTVGKLKMLIEALKGEIK